MTRKSSGSGNRPRRRNFKLLILAVAGIAILALGAVSAVTFSSFPAQQSAKFGGIGSAHDHAAFVVKIDGTYLDFSQDQYQVKSPFIHVENRNGTTLHKHALHVPFGEFLHSINMNVQNGCFVMDDGKQYCQEGDKSLRFFLNGAEQPASFIMNYVLEDNDRFLVLYGNETAEEIQQELQRLATISIFRT